MKPTSNYKKQDEEWYDCNHESDCNEDSGHEVKIRPRLFSYRESPPEANEDAHKPVLGDDGPSDFWYIILIADLIQVLIIIFSLYVAYHGVLLYNEYYGKKQTCLKFNCVFIIPVSC